MKQKTTRTSLRKPVAMAFRIVAAVAVVAAASYWIGIWAAVLILVAIRSLARRRNSTGRGINQQQIDNSVQQTDPFLWHRSDPNDPLWTFGWTRSRH